MGRVFERSHGGPARERTSTRPLSAALIMLSVLTVLAGTAHAQFPGTDENARIGIMGPDGEMQYLPTQEEMAAAASRGTDLSVFADYAQRRLELLSLVTEIVYVDEDAPVGGDGTSWKTAHQSLQDALAEDYSDRLVEIRMAQGHYRPDRFDGVNTNDAEATFTPRYEDTENPTGIYRITGGYAGLGAPDADQNDPDQFPTIITGDLLGNDGPDFTNYEDNSLALFSGFNSELHGLVMEHALQAMKGGAGRITIDRCLVRANAGTESTIFVPGSGATTFVGTLTIIKRSTFYKNRSGGFGGAIDSRSPHAAIVSNRFLSNEAQHGGGLFHYVNSGWGFSVLQNNYFAGNIVSGPEGSIGGAAAMYSTFQMSAGNTVVFNQSEDGQGAGYGSLSDIQFLERYNAFDAFHMNKCHSGSGVNEQLDSLPFSVRPPNPNAVPRLHFIRGSFVQDWESSATNDPSSYASLIDTIGQNSGEEVLFVDLAGPDGIIGTLDDDPTPRPDSPNIDRLVDTEQVEIALLDYADLNENGVVDEPLPFDLLGNPRSIDTPGIGEGGGIDAGAIEYAGDPSRFDCDKPITGQRIDPMDGCEGDEPIRLYVNSSGPVSGDGSSWDSPLLELYEALDIARSRCGPVEIWLAAGTYLPDFSVPLWRASFRPTRNVTLLGGFAGWEDKPDQRDPLANRTILSGDPLGNDDPADTSTRSDNAYRVVVFVGPRAGGTLDGLTIRSGSARAPSYAGFRYFQEICTYATGPLSRGAGVTVLSGDAEIRNCVIEQCFATFAPAVSLSGDGSLLLSSTVVSTDNIASTCPTDGIGNSLEATGINSLLARGTTLVIEDMTLRESEDTVPFNGSLSGNAHFHIRNSDVYLFGTGSASVINDARSIIATNSVLRGFRVSVTHRVRIENCTVVGLLNLGPVVTHPTAGAFEIHNSVVIGAIRSYVELNYAPTVSHSLGFHCAFPECEQFIRLSGASLNEMFVDLLGPSGNFLIPDGDYRLLPGSPAINTGSNALVTSDFDLDGNARIIGSDVDRGAYEFTGTCTGDVNGDGAINLADLNRVLANFNQPVPFGDADGSGSVDMTDLNIVIGAFGSACDG